MKGANAGEKYKCYFNPVIGNRFYSKNDVISFVKSGEMKSPMSEEDQCFNRYSTDNVIAQIEYSPDELPCGWIKETKFRESKGSIKKDPYYHDPVSGDAFRSLKAAIHYVETGDFGIHSFRPKKSVREMYSFEDEFPPSVNGKRLNSQRTARRCLFDKEIVDLNGHVAESLELHDRHLLPPSSKEGNTVQGQETPEEQISCLSCSVNRSRTQRQKAIWGRKSMSNLTKKFNERTSSEKEELPRVLKVTEKLLEPLQFKEHGDLTPDVAKLGEICKSGIDGMKSKVESEVTMEVGKANEKLAVSDETSKDFLGERMELIVANQKESDEACQPLSKDALVSEKEDMIKEKALTTEMERPKKGRRKAKSMIVTSMPQRRSKRLAGVQADPLSYLEDFSQHSHRSSKSIYTNHVLKEKETKADKSSPRSTMEEAVTMNLSTTFPKESLKTCTFGDLCLDPCIEFAFKTLTGDLPVLEDTLAVQEYFQQQLVSVQSSTSKRP